MPPRPSQSQRDADADSQKWEAALAFVRANNDLQKTIKQYGPLSPETKAAWKVVDKAQKFYNKVRRK